MKYLLAVLSIVLVVAGCSTDPVHLKHEGTGQIVQCGPYDNRPINSFASAEREIQCIRDYQRQGYERIPSP